uniref:Uncharacterized protein n=1 Tax=Picea sitchensis TaxID=3332 RepID=A9NWD3_PICSI|nr:unknown [Picea sitchensis]
MQRFAETKCEYNCYNLQRLQKAEAKMVKVSTFAAMTLGAFIFLQSVDKLHVWIALRQDEKRERQMQELEIAKMKKTLLTDLKEKESSV